MLFQNFVVTLHQNKMNDGIDRTTKEGLSLPRFLGDEGKSKEVSRIFATILERGCYQGDESQGTIQANWITDVENIDSI